MMARIVWKQTMFQIRSQLTIYTVKHIQLFKDVRCETRIHIKNFKLYAIHTKVVCCCLYLNWHKPI
jgi:hypothetical protein